MIKQVEMYTVLCDKCNKDVNDGAQYSCWSDIGYVQDIAFDMGWIKKDGAHYCPDCFTIDDDDNAVIVTTENNLVV